MSRQTLAAGPAGEQVARLVGARRTGDLLERPLGIASVEAALRVQADLPRGPVGGWKCGLPDADRLILAPIAADAFHRSGASLRFRTGSLVVEPELAFTLGRAIEREAPRAAVLDAVARVNLALELVHGRFRDRTGVPFLDMLADDLFNEGVVIGPEIALDRIQRIGAIRFDDGPPIAAAHPAGDPVAPLVWLAGHLAARGTPLREGDTIITGSLTPPETLHASRALAVSFGALGAVRATISLGEKTE